MPAFFKRCLLAFLMLIQAAVAWAANPVVELQTSAGRIAIELYPDKAPISVENFLAYVREGFYDGLIFHRVIDGFMIQGGGFDPAMKMKTPSRPPIKNEANNGLKNAEGTIAMARTRDPHSASSQFYINLVNNDSLDYPSFDGWGYAVFGKVIEGFDIVEKIGKVATGNKAGHQNVPLEAVVIQSAKLRANGK